MAARASRRTGKRAPARARRPGVAPPDRARELARLNLTISSSMDMGEVLNGIAKAATKITGAAFASFWMVDEAAHSLKLGAVSDDRTWRDYPARAVPLAEGGVMGEVARTRRPIAIPDVFRDRRILAPEWFRAHGFTSFFGVPIAHDRAVLAVLNLNGRAPFRFDADDRDRLGAFAAHAASAITNAQLFARETAARARAEASERALRESEERFRSVVENASDLITVLTPTGVIEYESPSVERLFGWRPEELLGKQLMDYVHPDDTVLLTEAIATRLADPAAVNPPVEFRARDRDGSWRILATTSRVSRSETGTVTLVATSRDVTERRALEEQLRQAHRLESVGRLAGGVAHDFNNLLTVIGGRAHLILSRLRPDDPLRRDIELIKKTGARAAQLTQQLLAFSRRQVLQPKVLDLNSVVAGLESILQRLIGEHIELVTSPAPGLGAVKADPGQLEQIIMNLALNARDAMPTGGRLTIQTAQAVLGAQRPASVKELEPGPYVLLTVSDSGMGMNEATRSQIFDPFFTTKEMGKGTGLGLATVYGIVRQSGGHITVESEPGRGARFTIYLPEVPDAARPREPSPATEDSPRGDETILLVEDEAAVRDLARDILELGGYRVLEATTTAEAERICREEPNPIHLLLTDVVMPQMSGRELAGRLTVARPAMRVLYMSGYTDDAIVHHGVLGQGPAFLPKPFTPGDLARKVREALDDGA